MVKTKSYKVMIMELTSNSAYAMMKHAEGYENNVSIHIVYHVVCGNERNVMNNVSAG